jgi:glutaredoxin 3
VIKHIVVFSKSYCPYCNSTKSLLSSLDAKFYSLELDQIGTYSFFFFLFFPTWGIRANAEMKPDDGAALQDALQEITNQRSVPNVFINQKHIGGNSDLQARKNELPQLLKDAGAL